MTQSGIGIVEKLLAWDRGIPDFIGDKYPTCETVSYRNPDGPEAAAIITEIVEALEGWLEAVGPQAVIRARRNAIALVDKVRSK